MKYVDAAKNYENNDTKSLFEIYKQNKDLVIRNILVERYIYLAKMLAKKYINKGVEFEDIYQVASLALIYAIDRFDVSKGYEFSSFATPTIIGEIKKYFRDKAWVLKVPRRVQELNKKINDAKSILEQANNSKPKVQDIAEYIGCTQEEVLECIEASFGYQPISLDASKNDSEDKEINIIDTIGNQDLNLANVDNVDFIKKFMEMLNEVEVEIFKDRFLLDKTQLEIANKLGVSQMTISRVEKKIIQKLKKEYEKNL